MKYLFSLLILSLLLVSFPPTTFAACVPLYGGGVTSQQACDGKVSTSGSSGNTGNSGTTKPKATPTPVRTNGGSTSKGGLPVLSPAPTQKTPSTGPELLGLVALIPAGAFGYYLRKKA